MDFSGDWWLILGVVLWAAGCFAVLYFNRKAARASGVEYMGDSIDTGEEIWAAKGNLREHHLIMGVTGVSDHHVQQCAIQTRMELGRRAENDEGVA